MIPILTSLEPNVEPERHFSEAPPSNSSELRYLVPNGVSNDQNESANENIWKRRPERRHKDTRTKREILLSELSESKSESKSKRKQV